MFPPEEPTVVLPAGNDGRAAGEATAVVSRDSAEPAAAEKVPSSGVSRSKPEKVAEGADAGSVVDTEPATAAAAAPPGAAEGASPGRQASGSDPSVPRLAEGIELLGEYEGSGFKEGRYLVKRSDGQMIQLTKLVYLLVENIDGRRDLEEIAARVSEGYGRKVSADNVKTLIDKNLYRDGIVVGPDGKVPELKKPDPLLQLKLRFTLVPPRAVNVIAGLLRPLFWPPVILAVLVGLVALDVWYFGIHGVGQGIRSTLYSPLTMLLLYALLVVSIGWHEFGHATACKYSGATPGKIGFGIYIIWPAFFTDVTEVYSLGKAGKVRTDLGGVYFNAIFSLAIGGVYFLTGFEPILTLILLQHLLIVYNFIPFLRLDGYFVMADSTGVPDLFGRIKPALSSLIPNRETPRKVSELKPRVRTVVTIWVLLVIPVLIGMFTMMVMSAPRVLSTTWDSLFVQRRQIASAMSGGNLAQAAVSGVQALMLILPVGGMSVTAFNVGKRTVSGLKNVYSKRPALGVALSMVAVAGLAFAGYILWPNGEYRPIQPGERWNVEEAVEAASEIDSGRPSLTEERQRELGGAPPVAPESEIDEPTTTSNEDSETGTEASPSPTSAFQEEEEDEAQASPSPNASP
ncbi:MAG TPA: hypothetical protein VHJ78_11375 [Actinomycetota bacterium]|nr:hypothetical protein [Actinomycetota bacterium]